MEGLLFLIGVYVLDLVIKKMAAKKKEKQSEQRQGIPEDVSEETQESTSQEHPPRNLQDLIRQFQEAQREASQGTYVPPDPTVKEVNDDEDEVELPVVQPANPGHFSFNEIAESVIQWEEVSIEYLQQAFGFSETTAEKVLEELQKHKIVGRDMGDGFCDVLIHDKMELANLFKREQLEAKKSMQEELERKKAELKSKWKNAQSSANAELDRQRKLNELEDRAREIREQNSLEIDATASSDVSETEDAAKRSQLPSRHISKEEVRRGFIWAKIIDEPRFRRRWTAKAR